MAITRSFTISDLANLPEDGSRYEIIDGELYVTAAPSFEHQAVLTRLVGALTEWDRDEAQGATLPGVGLIFALDTAVIPDLIWVGVDRYPAVFIDPASGRRDGRLHAAPDLVVEVLSPGTTNIVRDRETKLTLYSRRGVGEYWIVDRAAARVEIYRRREAALELAATLAGGDSVASPLLPGFALPLERLFRLPPGLPD